ncbi:MAG: peptide chain release factor N(5)-glutamine methyltransferase [Candidatus Omnitrophica bacterium]|nr:peptide chain release factor N(5)-glutamine methyltransferase [Candidatus Omnitrophota bacterium]
MKNVVDAIVPDWIAFGKEALSRAGIEEGKEECERILMKLLACDRFELYADFPAGRVSGVERKFRDILSKRVQRIPLAYLLGVAYFWKETLFVTPECLIPRPETEILIERVLETLGDRKASHFSFLDIGTGSGAIGVSILRECPRARGTFLDVSRGALAVARTNVERCGFENRAQFVHGDLFDGLGPGAGSWDVMVSNPPYLAAADWNGVQEELKSEPREALDGGADGLDFYRRITAQAGEYLVPEGMLALEVGQGQSGVVSKWLHNAGYDNIQRFRDYSGIERVVIARKGGF